MEELCALIAIFKIGTFGLLEVKVPFCLIQEPCFFPQISNSALKQTLRAVFNIPSLVSKIIPSGEETPVGDAPVPSQTQPTELQFHSALRDRQAS